MYVVMITFVLLGQVNQPNQPTVEIPETQVMKEEMLAHIYVNKGQEAMAKAEEMFESQSDRQIRIIYKIFTQKKKEAEQTQKAQRQAILDQAKLNLANAQAYRDHLKREFQMKMHIKQQELATLKKSNIWTQYWINRQMFMQNQPRFYAPRYGPYQYYGRPYYYGHPYYRGNLR